MMLERWKDDTWRPWAVPVVYDDFVPKGQVYLLNQDYVMLLVGTGKPRRVWWKPWTWRR